MAFTTGVESWSTSANSNDDADSTINWLENQPASTVNNSARAMMAVLKSWHDKIVASRFIGGLTLSNNGSDATNDIDIAAGASTDSTNAVVMKLSSGITKQLDAAWAVGTNQGGLDTGSIANDVYHVFQIMRSDTGVVDALFSASATSPTMPTNYDYKRRIGAIIRSGGAILAFTQLGDWFRLSTAVLDINVTNPGTSAVTRTLTVPDGIRVKALVNALIVNTGDKEALYLSELAASDQAVSSSGSPLLTLRQSVNNESVGTQVEIYTNTSAQIRSRVAVGDANTSLRIATLGWTDFRGKND